VGQDHKDKPAITVDVGPDSISAHVSEGALARLGDAVAWLAPKHSAKVKITSALAERVAIKITSHEALDDQDAYFVSAMFHKEARKLANQEAVAQRVEEVLPEVQDRVRSLPPYRDRGTSRAFLGRAETIAAEITEDEFRDLFARVLAGEVCRPGSFSMRTLEIIPLLLDPEVASSFEVLRRLAFNIETNAGSTPEWGTGWIWNDDTLLPALNRAGIAQYGEKQAINDLTEAGLVRQDISLTTQFLNASSGDYFVFRYGDQLLRIQPVSGPEIDRGTLFGLRLTRTGREIASVLAQGVDAEYFGDGGQWLSNLLGASAVVEWRREPAKDWIAIPVSKKS
jgi:hypothetical protein